MRVVSLVPSWTETLLEAGVEVVGRTRYCVHPAERVKAIPVVGGTKDWNLAKILELKPDFVLLDREENPKFMAEQSPFPFHATHVRAVEDLGAELDTLAALFQAPKLAEFAARARDVAARPAKSTWYLQPTVLYLIWRKPWMCVSRTTYIGSVLSRLGLGERIPDFAVPYPEIRLEDFDREKTLLLFSSEPYPFSRQKEKLARLGFSHEFVDGESFSWFGLRSLIFLENELRK